MITFNLGEKDFNLPTEWEEITLGTYLKLSEIGSSLENKYAFNELYVMRVLEILTGADSGDLDDLTIQALNELSSKISYLNSEPKMDIFQHIEIEGKDYAFPEDLYQITAGEYISIKTLQEHEKNPTEFYLHLLSILLRPAKKIKNLETGKDKWIQEKFHAENLCFRRDLYKNLPITKVLGTINFFLNGKDMLKDPIRDFTKEGVQEVMKSAQ
jgi:hypothetical protein